MGLIIVISIMSLVMTVAFRKIGYGLVQSTILGLLLSVPVIVEITLAILTKIVNIIQMGTYILGGTDYKEVLKKYAEFSKNNPQ